MRRGPAPTKTTSPPLLTKTRYMKKKLLAILLIMVAVMPAMARGHRVVTAARDVTVPQLKLDDWRTLNYDSVQLRPSGLFMPLIFNRLQQFSADSATTAPSTTQNGLPDHSQWLDSASNIHNRVGRTRFRAMVAHPELVRFNTDQLPEPPKEYVVKADPKRNMLTVDPFIPESHKPGAPVDRRRIKRRNWLHTFTSSLQFTQAYISDNWYQGGENNINVLGDVEWQVSLNQTLHPKLLFTNTVHYKLGVMTAHSDSLRNYSISEDNLQINTKFGYKAVKNWYYSATMQFKTQFFNNYKSNTHTMTAALLSPGELNLGLGMTYNYTDPKKDRSISLSIAPASYNMKICQNITDLSPTSFGINEGHHVKHNLGSNLECKFTWGFNANISWSARLYAFTDYSYVQGDFENTFDFSITRHLQTKIYVHLRYDKSHDRDSYWGYWQLKEILSFGLTYRFATN